MSFVDGALTSLDRMNEERIDQASRDDANPSKKHESLAELSALEYDLAGPTAAPPVVFDSTIATVSG